MRAAPAAVGTVLAAAALLAGPLAGPEWGSGLAGQAAPQDRLQALFLGDDGHHRPLERAREILPVLAANGVDMFYTDDPAALNPDHLARYHALILYNNQPAISPEQVSALLGFVEAGGGLVVLHSASASFQNSEPFIKLVGAAFKSHGTGTFSTIRAAPEHPAIRDVPVFESWDETYVHTKHNPVDRTVLEVRREGDHEEPWTWVRTYGEGRVFYTAWGHDHRTWGQEGFRKLLVQGLRWAAGDWALQRIASAEGEEPLPMETLPVPLPVYERPPAPWNTLAAEHIREAQAALTVERSLPLSTVPPGFTVDWFATEPMIGRIIDFTWDERGRMWAVETNDYPNRVLEDTIPGGDRVLILEDTSGDGRADQVTVFADGFNLATSLVHAGGGLVVAQAPHMIFLRDTTGNDQADVREILMTGWPRNDTHGTPSNLRYGLDNWILGSVGYNGFRGTVGGRTWEPGELRAGYFRFPADGSDLDYLARTSNNTWGVALDEGGHVFGSTANSRPSNFVHIPARYYHALGLVEPVLPGIEDRSDIYPLLEEIRQVDQFGRYTAGAAHEIYTARAFPREYWNRAAFVAEPTGHLVGRFDLEPDGSGFRARNRWNFLASRDTWKAPVQVKVGPDGALWVADFYTLVAQHNPTPQDMDECCERGPGNAYETPNRDAERARLYRVAHEDAPPYAPLRLDRAGPGELVQALRHDNMFWRLTAQRLLVEGGERDGWRDQVVPSLLALLSDQRMDELGLNPGALHALWTLDGLGTVRSDPAVQEAVRLALHHPSASVRRAALQVLPRSADLEEDIFAAGMLPDRSAPGEMDFVMGSGVLQDADPGVRLAALLALSELPPTPRGAAAVAEVLSVPANARDPWIPEAAAIAGAPHGPGFLGELLKRDIPADSAALAGLGRAVELLAHHHSRSGVTAPVLGLITGNAGTEPMLLGALLRGIAEGWPEARPPDLSPDDRSAFAAMAAAAAAGDAPPEVVEGYRRVAERWGMPDLLPEGATEPPGAEGLLLEPSW